MEKYCRLGSLHSTPHQRYGIVRGGSIVSVQISKPNGEEVPLEGLKWKVTGPAFDMTPERLNAQAFSIGKAGEQPRRPVWKRAGRTAAPQ